MNISQLRTFAAVAKSGNVTRAAKFLHLSQPAVSGQIRALEEELGTPLFERMPSGMKLTKFGEEVLVNAELVIAKVSEIVSRSRVFRGEVSGHLSVATIVHPDFLHLGEFIHVMRERFPLVEVELRHGLSGKALEGVLNGDVTAGFYIGNPPEPPLMSLSLKTITYVVAAPAAWADQVEGATLEEIAALPWITTPKQGSRYHLVRKLFQGRQVKPANVVEANSEPTILSLIAAGVGLSFVREEVTRNSQHKASLAVWDTIKQDSELLFIYHASNAGNPIVRAAISAVTEIFCDEPVPGRLID